MLIIGLHVHCTVGWLLVLIYPYHAGDNIQSYINTFGLFKNTA